MENLKDLNIVPGLCTIKTDRGDRARWKNGDKVRFRYGLPQKIGGWQKNNANTFAGKWRGVNDWQTLSLEKFIAVGTHLKWYNWKGGTYYDVTPIRSSGSLAASPFTTTNGSAVVTVTHVAHGALTGDYVTFGGAAVVGGITVDGEYSLTYVDNDHYTITHSAIASIGASGGGATVTYAYQIHIGVADSVFGRGFGASSWGASTWGTTRSASNFLNMARTWSFDPWGEDLIACPRDGGIYVWDASASTGTRATALGAGPTTAKFIMVSPENRQIVAFGVDGDPLLVKWCSAENYLDWTASATNTAGRKRLDAGNELMCAAKLKGETLVQTDSWAYTMIFDGPPYNFGWRSIGGNGGIRGPNAMKEVDGRAYWMGKADFYYYDGAIRTLSCEVHNHVFDDINSTQSAKVFCGYNREFTELWWFYCSANSTECDRYVAYNINEKTWSFGTMARTVYVGDSDTFNNAYAGGSDGYLYDQEYGTDADGVAMVPVLESGDIEIGEGGYMMRVRALVPDFKLLTGSVSVTLKARRYPHSTEQVSGAVQIVTSSTQFVNPHIRGRQISLYITSTSVGDAWRMGMWRVDLKPHGKK